MYYFFLKRNNTRKYVHECTMICEIRERFFCEQFPIYDNCYHGYNPQLANVVNQILEHVKTLPRYLIPCYFDAVISVIHREVVSSAIAHMSK